MRRLALLALLALLAPAAATAARGPTWITLMESSSPPELRARLAVVAESTAVNDPVEAADAWYHAGMSFAREGERDSAIACYQRAVDRRGSTAQRMALAEALVQRAQRDDLARAIAALRPLQPLDRMPGPDRAEPQALLAWTHFIAGRLDSAVALFAPVQGFLSRDLLWCYRMGCVSFERNDVPTTFGLLTPVAVAARGFDRDVNEMLVRSLNGANRETRVGGMIARELAQRDTLEAELLGELGARRISFSAGDGFPLGAAILGTAGPARRRAAIVLTVPGDTLASYDSLAVGLRRAGLAVLLLDARGSGRSLTPGLPVPQAWIGREASLQFRSAEDVRDALRALSRETRLDTTGYLVVGVGPTAGVAIEAANMDPRVTALLLLSPLPAAVDRGPLRTLLAAMRRPVYFQTAPDDFATYDVVDALYGACDMRASRVADAEQPGNRAPLLRRDPKIILRFQQWLRETWSAPPAPRTTPRAAPRRG